MYEINRIMVVKEKIDYINQLKLSSGFSAALRICRKLQGSRDLEDVVDFSHIKFVSPTFVIPLVIHKRFEEKDYDRKYESLFKNDWF